MTHFLSRIIVPEWRRALTVSWSLWAAGVGILGLGAVEVLFAFTGRDTDPYRMWWVSFLLLLVGFVGRLILQPKQKRWSWLIFAGILAAVWVASGVLSRLSAEPAGSGAYELAMGDWGKKPAPAPAARDRLPVSDEAFLQVALPHLAKWEGLSLTAYLDKIARPPVWTVCHGETRGVKPGDRYTREECAAMLAPRALEFRRAFHRQVQAEILAILRVEPDAAITGLGYNIGQGALAKSTVIRRLNAGDIAGACEALTWWNKAGGRVIRGLVNRRTDEHALCMRGA